MGRGRDPLRRPRPEGSGPHLPRARAPASRERPPGASSMGRRPHRVRRGAARGQGLRRRRRLVPGAPRGGVFAASRADSKRGEAFLLDALERFHRKDDRTSLQGRGWAFLNLAALYGKTGRLDLAFVTFTKAQDVLGATEDWAGVAAAWEAQAQLRRAIHDDDRWREDLAEAVLFYDREGMKAKADRLRALLGRKRV